jgi:hypothetical protein
MILSLFAVVILVVAVFAVTLYFFSGGGEVVGEKKTFYVGVTYCGNTAQEAKLLVDKVKGYTNLFVLQSGPLVSNGSVVFEIGDYAVSNGLHFAAYYNTPAAEQNLGSWVGMAEERWGSMFAGLYYNDEPGGEFLDSHVEPIGGVDNATGGGTGFRVIKEAGGVIRVIGPSEFFVFRPNGEIEIARSSNGTMYYPDGAITFYSGDGDVFFMMNGTCQMYDSETGSTIMVNDTSRIPQVESYEEALAYHPFPDSAAAAEAFVDLHRGKMELLVERWLP